MSKNLKVIVLLAALALVAAACSSDSTETSPTVTSTVESTTSSPATVTTVTTTVESTTSSPATVTTVTTEASYPFEDGDSVTIIVATSAGGGFDTEARLLQPFLQDLLSERAGGSVTVRVENAPGGDGRIGSQLVHRARPDDNFVWYYFTNTLVGAELQDGAQATYAAEDFVPLAVWGYGPSAFVLPDSLELSDQSIQGLSARSVDLPLLIGGVGLDNELAIMAALLEEAGLPFNYEIVQGAGTSDTIAFLLRGDVEVGYSTGAGLLPHVAGNPELNFLVSTACETDPSIPDVPTIGELGWPNADQICAATSVPRVFLGGPQMPEDIAAALSDALLTVLSDADFAARAEEVDHYLQPGGADAASDAVTVKRELFLRFADLLGF